FCIVSCVLWLTTKPLLIIIELRGMQIPLRRLDTGHPLPPPLQYRGSATLPARQYCATAVMPFLIGSLFADCPLCQLPISCQPFLRPGECLWLLTLLLF